MPIWRSPAWKTAWFVVRRSGRDRRARRTILAAVCWLLAAVAYFWRFLYLPAAAAPHDRWALAFYAFIFGTGFLAFLILRRVNRGRDAVLNLSITGRTASAPAPASDPSPIRGYVEERATIVAALLLRSASEVCVADDLLGPGARVLTRQVHNQMLRERGFWDKLEPAERDLLFVADGQWTAQQRDGIIAWSEQMRLLRWTLRMDEAVMPLSHAPPIEHTLSSAIIQSAVFPERPLLLSSDLRHERDLALLYTARCTAELRARRLIPDAPDFAEWADEFRNQSLGDSTDFVVGAHTVADLADDDLRLFAATCNARYRYAAYLTELLSASSPFPFLPDPQA